MAKTRSVQSDFVRGIRDGMPIALGYVSVSAAFGMSICAAGFPVWLAGLISLTNVTSAGQFAGTGLILEEAPYIEIAVTTFVINLRYFLMSLSLTQKLDPTFNNFRRLSAAFGVTDEIFAVAVGKPGVVTPSYMHGLILSPVIGWTTGTVLGGIFSQVLPQVVVSAMSIALYAMFIAIVLPPAVKQKPVAITAILAVALSCIIAYVPVFSFISSGWSIIIVTVLVSAFAAWKFPVDEESDTDVDAVQTNGNASGVCASNGEEASYADR